MTVKTKTVCAFSVLVACHMAAAQEATPASDAPLPLVIATSWASQNRFVEVSAGQRQQDYQESDTQGLTSNGVLDTETGSQNHIGIALRWQTSTHWLVQLQAQRQSGATDYNGYLQLGDGSLTPYRAHTGNTATDYSIQLGYTLHTGNWPVLPAHWLIAPMAQFGKHHWQRNLVQYSETYDFKHYAFGALLQWQLRPGTVVAAQALQGRTRSAFVSVPALGFAAEQPGGNWRELQLGISQDLGGVTRTKAFEGWRVAARYIASDYAHGASPITNGLQAPPNQHRPSAWTLGLQKLF